MELPDWVLPVASVVVIAHVLVTGAGYLFNKMMGAPGNKFSITSSLLIWIVVCVAAYFVQTDIQFFTIAAGVGLVMGGIQSMSRSTYSKLIPEETEDTTSYFSFYDVLEKLSIMIGTFGFGLTQILGGMRNAVLVLAAFFIIGILILRTVKMKSETSAIEVE